VRSKLTATLDHPSKLWQTTCCQDPSVQFERAKERFLLRRGF
jgi:hypothetical protein